MDFILNNLFTIILVLIGLMVVGFLFRALKTALFIGIIIVILGSFGFLGDGFNEKAKDTLDLATNFTQEKAVPFIQENLASAEFSFDKETGAYVIGTDDFKINGTEGSNVGTLTTGKTSFELDVSFLSDYVNENIAAAKAN